MKWVCLLVENQRKNTGCINRVCSSRRWRKLVLQKDVALRSITIGYVVDDTAFVHNSELFGSAEQDHEQCAGQIELDLGESQFPGGVHDCAKAHVPALCMKRNLSGEVPNPKKCSVGFGLKTIESR